MTHLRLVLPVDDRMWCPEIPERLTGKPTDTEISEAGMFCKGQITAADLVFICQSQVRAGHAIDAWMKKNGRNL